jgi:transcription-repair coupling factor (superfamily II helicase)
MERLPPPASLSRLSMSLKVGGTFSERELRMRLEGLGYDLEDVPDRGFRSERARHDL